MFLMATQRNEGRSVVSATSDSPRAEAVYTLVYGAWIVRQGKKALTDAFPGPPAWSSRSASEKGNRVAGFVACLLVISGHDSYGLARFSKISGFSSGS